MSAARQAVAAAALALCATGATTAVALERAGDALHTYQLEAHARVEAALEYELAQTIAGLPERDRFELYRTSNQLIGTWSQVAFLQSLLELSSAVESPSLEAELRATLRAQAEFVQWELDQADERLARTASEGARDTQTTAAVRAFLAQVARTVGAVDADERARPPIATAALR
jgi:hypothetical protein